MSDLPKLISEEEAIAQFPFLSRVDTELAKELVFSFFKCMVMKDEKFMIALVSIMKGTP